jgi:hypothetical protein
MSEAKYIFEAVKKGDHDSTWNFQINFTDSLVPVIAEMSKDLATQGWEVKTLRETLLPWDLTQS